MAFLMFQILVSLLVAALIGAGAVWLLRRDAERRRVAKIEREWRERLRQVELDRDRSVRRLTSELETRGGSNNGDDSALEDYEKLVSGLEERVAERESVIGELRVEIQSLRDGLRKSEQEAGDLLSGHEQELLAIQAEQERDEQQSQQQLSERDTRITRLEADVEERENELTELRQRLADASNEAVADTRRIELLTERESRINELEQQIKARDASIHRLQEQTEKERREAADNAAARGEAGRQAARVDELETIIIGRDEHIARLQAELKSVRGQSGNDRQTAEQARLRHDEALRAAIAEAESLQRQLDGASGELEQRKEEVEALRDALAAAREEHPGRRKPRGKKRRKAAHHPQQQPSGDKRISSALTRPDAGPRDNLQEIRGVGPALEKTLNDIGIHHFHQIAAFDAADIGRVAREIGHFGSRIERDDWVGQARNLHQKYHG